MKSRDMVFVVAMLLLAPLAIQSASAQTASQKPEYSPRGEAVFSIVQRWGPHVQEAYTMNVHEWAREMGPAFASVPLDRLQAAARAKNFDAMNNAILGKSAAAVGAVTPKVLGDIAKDLVFVPVAPCRILDTRLAIGQIAANTIRPVDVTSIGSYSFQGGASTDCGVGAAGSFAAAAINFTVVSPSAAGYITAYPVGGTQPLAATVNYTAGSIVGNYAVVKLDQGPQANELNVYSFAATHLVADIVGYYVAPERVALECEEKETAPVSVSAGGVTSLATSACSVGYTVISGGCTSSSFDGRVVSTRTVPSSNNHFCAWRNEGTSAMNAIAYARCCRNAWGN